jgi:hypothetical protein
MKHVSTMRRFGIGAVIVLAGVLLGLAPSSVHAAGTVGDGTPASCTEAAFDAALTGGGLVTFDCGPAARTIVLTYYKQIGDDTEIQGADKITLSGANTTPHFQVYSGKSLTLRDITLARGNGTFGSIQNFGTLRIVHSQVNLSNASDSGGAIENYGVVTLEDSTVGENQAANRGGGIFNDTGAVTVSGSRIISNTAQSETGGGIWSSGTLTVSNSTLAGNAAASGGGGGVFNAGSLSLTDSSLADNRASFAGPASGGGLNHASGLAHLSGVTFDGNTSNTYGGGLFIQGGNLSASEMLFTHNTAVVGAAVSNSGTFTLTNSLVYSNTADGAAIIANGMAGSGATNIVTAINVTVSGNVSSSANGSVVESDYGVMKLIFATIVDNVGYGVGRGPSSSTLRLKDTIVAGNSPMNCPSGITSDGFNIASDNSCVLTQVSDRSGTDPALGPLADNGGRTETYLPQTGSPAIDGGQCVTGVDTDQRGEARPYGAACDVGAVEVGAPAQTKSFLPSLFGG